jgi:hypothetical protein
VGRLALVHPALRGDLQGDQALLGAIVKIALDAEALLVHAGNDART